VRKRSCAGMLRGGISQARRKCEIFSICMNGIADFLNLTPGVGTAKLMSLDALACSQRPTTSNSYLHSAVPSFSASSKSPGGSLSPSTSSIQLRTSFAAFGVYRSIRSFLMSWSSDVTDAMVGELGANRAVVDVCARGRESRRDLYELQC
jgi:hypothetical protein